jgi:type II secretory pathway pseudopilin PulG
MEKHSNNSGFTLVELTITLGIFVFVISLILSIFTNSLKAERNVASQTAILDNLSLVIEQMARDIRTGTDFPNPSSSSSFSFTNAAGQEVTYEKPLNETYIVKKTSLKTVTLTAADIKITKLNFYVIKPNFYPPRVTIQIQVESPLFAGPLTFQTTVSERLFYYKAS